MISAPELESRIERIPFSGCWVWMGSCEKGGYGDVRRGGYHKTVHRLSYELYRGPIPSGLHVLHRCDVRLCVNPDHLFIGTNADNIADRDAKGRTPRPSYRPSGLKYQRRSATAYDELRKVTLEQREEIRAAHAGGVSKKELAAQYGVSYRNVWGWVTGKN